MEIPPPPRFGLVRQTCDMPIPPVDPVWAAENSKKMLEYHEAYWKPIMDQAYAKDREWRLANKEMIEAKEAAWKQLIKDSKDKDGKDKDDKD